MRPRYVRWMIRTALGYLMLGTLLGALMFAGYRVPGLRGLHAWRSLHVHLILMGGVIQMIMGVALWMFPGRRQAPARPADAQGWVLYAVFNAGTLLRSVFHPGLASDGLFAVAALGVALQLGGLGWFLALVLGRIRPPLSER